MLVRLERCCVPARHAAYAIKRDAIRSSASSRSPRARRVLPEVGRGRGAPGCIAGESVSAAPAPRQARVSAGRRWRANASHLLNEFSQVRLATGNCRSGSAPVGVRWETANAHCPRAAVVSPAVPCRVYSRRRTAVEPSCCPVVTQPVCSGPFHARCLAPSKSPANSPQPRRQRQEGRWQASAPRLQACSC